MFVAEAEAERQKWRNTTVFTGTAFQKEIERGIMTESSPQPHVTKAADQIKSFLSFSKIFSCNFLH